MEITIFGITLLCIIDVALILFGVELIGTLNLDAFIAVLVLFFATNWTCLFFCLSEWITMDLLKIGDHFYNSPWYFVLSAKERELLTLAIQQAQREIRLKGLGFFDGSLVIFSSVILVEIRIVFVAGMIFEGNYDAFWVLQILRTAASYFIILRRIR